MPGNLVHLGIFVNIFTFFSLNGLINAFITKLVDMGVWVSGENGYNYKLKKGRIMDVWFILWMTLGPLVGAAIGHSKGRALAGAAWGVFAGPLGWIIMLIAPDVRIKCPDCGGEVVKDARKCKNCGSFLNPAN